MCISLAVCGACKLCPCRFISSSLHSEVLNVFLSVEILQWLHLVFNKFSLKFHFAGFVRFTLSQCNYPVWTADVGTALFKNPLWPLRLEEGWLGEGWGFHSWKILFCIRIIREEINLPRLSPKPHLMLIVFLLQMSRQTTSLLRHCFILDGRFLLFHMLYKSLPPNAFCFSWALKIQKIVSLFTQSRPAIKKRSFCESLNFQIQHLYMWSLRSV